VDLKFGTENGQTLFSMGKTKVLTATTLTLVSPQPAKPNEGFFRFNLDFGSLVHSGEAANAA